MIAIKTFIKKHLVLAYFALAATISRWISRRGKSLTIKETKSMNVKKYIFPSLLVCTTLALTPRLFAQPASAKPASGSDSYNAIDAYIEQQMQRLNIPGVSLAIVEGDKIMHLRGFGQARPDGEAPSPQTPFFIGSLTKSITALAVMQLVEAGKIDLDAPVQHYLSWFQVADPQASAQMTVRHLLNQTSGLPTSAGEIQMADFDDSQDATERQARALSTLKLSRPVGSAFEYSNSNYNLLGLIIETASGELYADYVQKHIFTPLDMNHSYTSQAIAKQNDMAVGHQYWFATPFVAPNIPVPHGSLPAGQLISSSEDMAHYMIALLNEGRYGDVQILSRAGIDELYHGVAEDIQMGISFGKYGMGWFIDESGQTKLIWHSGTTPNFGAFMALLPEQKKGVILLFNANHHWMTPVLSDLGAGMAALLAGNQPAPIQFVGLIPWMLRAQLLIPLFQIIGVAATLRLLRRWHQNPDSRPSGGRKWGGHILLPLIPNLLVALTLLPMLGDTRGYLRLYMPDYSWIAIICGGFAGIWSFLRTGLVMRALKSPRRF
ncbi:MAG: beta-lactamase family protein [Anaerolineae bacterium]|nr:beta-lactamase family protein [Anaerolineae bacterium]